MWSVLTIEPNEVIAKNNQNIIDDMNILEQQLTSILDEHDYSLCCWAGNIYIFDNSKDNIVGQIKF